MHQLLTTAIFSCVTLSCRGNDNTAQTCEPVSLTQDANKKTGIIADPPVYTPSELRSDNLGINHAGPLGPVRMPEDLDSAFRALVRYRSTAKTRDFDNALREILRRVCGAQWRSLEEHDLELIVDFDEVLDADFVGCGVLWKSGAQKCGQLTTAMCSEPTPEGGLKLPKSTR